jgi:tRNA pseudouridine55 synthase
VGHGGTLDPAVTGVLPIAVGLATRLLPYLEGDKHYVGSLQLGRRTLSDDLAGATLAEAPVPPLSREDLEEALQPFRGTILQRPPQVSAVHVQGQRAHERVRRGERLELEARPVRIERLELLAWDPQHARLTVALHCSAGTYIRALARDLGESLGCGGCLAELRRTGALGFSLAQAVPLDRLGEPPLPPLLDPLAALTHLPQRRLTEEERSGWRCGRALADGEGPQPAGQAVAVLGPDGNLSGMARADGQGLLQPKLVFDAAG